MKSPETHAESRFTAGRNAGVDSTPLRREECAIGGLQRHCNGTGPGDASRFSPPAAPVAIRTVPTVLNSRPGEAGSPSGQPHKQLTVSSYNRLNAKTKQHAHKLRQALAGAIELHQSGRWSRAEVEAAGLRDYPTVFGHAISPRHFWRIFDRVIDRDGGKGDFSNLQIYLPGRLVRKEQSAAFEKYAQILPSLGTAIQSVKDANRLTDGERLLVWDSALSEYQRLIDQGSGDRRARRTIIMALDASGLPLALTRPALARNFCRKLDRWIEGGEKPSAIRDLRLENPGRAPRFNPTKADIDLLIAHSLAKGSLRRAWREAIRDRLLSPGAAGGYLANPASKSYVPASISQLVLPEVERLRPWHRGPRQARLNGAYITRDWSDTLPGDWYQADDTTLPLYYWEEDEAGRPRILRGQFLPMIDVRTNRVLTFALHSERNYTATVVRGLILRTHDRYGLPRVGFHFENGIWRKSKIIAGTQASGEAVNPSETELGLREWVRFMHAKPGNARSKKVERIIGLLQDRMEDQPGYCGRNEQTEKFERVQGHKLDVESGRVHPSKFFLHRDEWIERLGALCEVYNNERQDGELGGISPREAWEQLFDYTKPLIKLTSDTRWLLANHRALLKVTRNGITVRVNGRNFVFRNEVTAGLIGQEAHVYFNPEDLSSCFLKLSPSDITAEVIPLAPAVPATTATREQLDSANASLATHNRTLNTRYKEIAAHFPENAPSPFREVVADEATIQAGRQVAEEQTAIKAGQQSAAAEQRRANQLRRRHGADAQVPLSRLEAADRFRRKLAQLSHDNPTTER
jgi:hypothetical protein